MSNWSDLRNEILGSQWVKLVKRILPCTVKVNWSFSLSFTFTYFSVDVTFLLYRADRKQLVFDLVNVNSNASWFSTVPNNENFERLEITGMRQLEKDVVVVCYESKCRISICFWGFRMDVKFLKVLTKLRVHSAENRF